MTKRIPQPRSELPPQIRTHEAQLLAVMLRTSRLTWVFAEPGTDKSSLLTTGVLPLLQRRQTDHQVGTPTGAPRLPDRRRRPLTSAKPQREAALYFDSWQQPAPLAHLKQRIDDLIPESRGASARVRLAYGLQRLGQSGVDLVLLLDRFEEFLALSPGEDQTRRFVDELLEAIAVPGVSARFLISMDENARPQLERFRARIPGFDHNVLRLSPIAAVPSVVPPLRTPPATAAAAPPLGGSDTQRGARSAARPRRAPSPRVAMKVEDVYAFIENTLARTAGKASSVDERSGEDKAAFANVPEAGGQINPASEQPTQGNAPNAQQAHRFAGVLKHLGRRRGK